MSIIIYKKNNEYWLHEMHHSPANFSPFTNSHDIHNFSWVMIMGRMRNIDGLKINKEYFLDFKKDFIVSERIKQIKHKNGLIHDDLYYSYINRKLKLEKIKEKINKKYK